MDDDRFKAENEKRASSWFAGTFHGQFPGIYEVRDWITYNVYPKARRATYEDALDLHIPGADPDETLTRIIELVHNVGWIASSRDENERASNVLIEARRNYDLMTQNYHIYEEYEENGPSK